MTWRVARVRGTAACLLAATALLLSGCVYLRLLQLKRQIADFEDNFTVLTDDGVKILCRNPVLLSRDVRWIGLEPEKTKKVGAAEQWQVRWVKQLPSEIHETGAFDIVIDFLFVEDRMTRVSIPERYFQLMPKSLLVDLLRSLGHAKVDRDNRSVEAQLASSRPDLPGIEKLLGRPSAETIEGGQTLFRYRYIPVASKRLARAAVFDMTVHFDTKTGELLRWQGVTPVGKVGFNFDPSSEQK